MYIESIIELSNLQHVPKDHVLEICNELIRECKKAVENKTQDKVMVKFYNTQVNASNLLMRLDDLSGLRNMINIATENLFNVETVVRPWTNFKHVRNFLAMIIHSFSALPSMAMVNGKRYVKIHNLIYKTKSIFRLYHPLFQIQHI